MDKDGTSDLIEGNTGVYMLKVTNKTEAADIDNYSTYAQNLQTSASARVNGAVYNALKDKAEIEDNRAIFY
jgi:peptidyl-prolyl cis-trans isomerase D